MSFRLNYSLLLGVFTFFISNLSVSQSYERPPAFAKKVYEDLCGVMNDNHTNPPKLVLSTDVKEVATFNPVGGEEGESVIILGSSFIQMVRNFGKDSSNALAHVLGHELAHVYLNQLESVKQIGSGYASPELNKKIKQLKNELRDSIFERQADEHSAFYCHIAGYKTVNIGEVVLDSIYKRFKLNDKMLSRYPPLDERKEIVRNSHRQMNALKLMFDDGVIALVGGNYKMARVLFTTITKEKYTSREIYNNLGIACLMDAIDDLDSLEYPYIFPLQIDVVSKLDLGSERGGLNYDTKEKLEEAIRNFNHAISNSNDYSIGFLNKAIAQFLLEDYEGMENTLLIAEKIADNNLKISIEVLKAIHLHKINSVESSLALLKELSKSSEIAKRNLAQLNGEKKMVQENESLNSEISNRINLVVPNHSFSTQQAKEGIKLIASLSSKENYSLRVSSDEKFESRRWSYLYGSTKPMMDIYQEKTYFSCTDLEWKNLIKVGDSYFKFGNIEYIRIRNLVFKKNKNEVKLFIIK